MRANKAKQEKRKKKAEEMKRRAEGDTSAGTAMVAGALVAESIDIEKGSAEGQTVQSKAVA